MAAIVFGKLHTDFGTAGGPAGASRDRSKAADAGILAIGTTR